MTPRENLNLILRRQGGDHIPFSFSLTPSLLDAFEKEHGTKNIVDFYNFDLRHIDLLPSTKPLETGHYYKGRTLKKGTWFDANGVAHEPGSVEHFSRMVSPLAGQDTTVEELEQFPLNDRDAEYRFANLDESVREIQDKGFATGGLVGHIFETAWQIRGMEDMLMDFYVAPEKAEMILERITKVNEILAARLAKSGVDVILFGDDVGTQIGMMMSPEIWRQFLKPRLAREIRAARKVNKDVLVWYHSDGDISTIIPDLIEVGVDLLNPVQPECVDPVALKKEYGDRLSFWGCVGTQTTMPFGTPDDVRNKVRDLVEKVGYNGGLYLSPTHVLEPEVTWENIDAFVEACHEYGAINTGVI